MTDMQRRLKRVLDISASMVLLVILSPVMLCIYLILQCGNRQAIYSSRRLGKNGVEFNCLKFRTMLPGAEHMLAEILEKDPKAAERWETHRKLYNDPRTTRFGRFLRRNSLDELPQFINVLKGEMSLVGPRPILKDEVIFFNNDQLVHYYSVRPGITGLWQVSGRNKRSFHQRVVMDEQYISTWSLWEDIIIIGKTFGVVLRRSGVY